MKKISVLFTVIVLSLFSGSVLGFTGGDGSSVNPYQIYTKADLEAVNDDLLACYILMNDIDLSGTVYIQAVIAHPVGTSGNVFKGSFDGNGFTVNNLVVNGDSSVGLFGRNYSGAVIKNLGLEDCSINGTVFYAGGLAGVNFGSITNCYSSGYVSGDYYVGGLVGMNPGSVTNCYSTGTISGDSEVGGLAGWNTGSVTNSYSTGVVSGGIYVGGLVGNNYGSIANCYSIGSVSGDSEVGGLGGKNTGSITGSFWDMQTSGIGKGVGTGISTGVDGKTTAEMQTQSTFETAGWDFVGEMSNGTNEAWQMPEAGGYPELAVFNGYVPVQLNGEGSAENPYLIRNPNELGAIIHFNSSAHYKLTNNIDLSGIQWSTAIIPSFIGVFDGDGFTINNLMVNGGGGIGLFGRTDIGADIKNLGLEDCSINCIGSLVASLVGKNSGSIANCYSTGYVSGDASVGGLVGYNYGSITSSYSTGTVNGDRYVGGLVGNNRVSITNSYSTAVTNGAAYHVGGLTGGNSGSIADSYSIGAVSADGNGGVGGLVGINDGSITNSYSTGAVSGDFYSGVGGLAGWNRDRGSITDCFWDTQASGTDNGVGSGAGICTGTDGKTTAEMQTQSTFETAGWDFVGETSNGTSEIWQMPGAGGYPELAVLNGYVPVQLSGDGSAENPYLIGDLNELGAIIHYESSAHYKLTNNIDLAGIQWSTSVIPSFIGIFDGDGFTINNFIVNSGAYIGVFGRTDIGTDIKNLGLEDCSINGTGSYVASLVGYNYGSITNCYSTGTVSGDRSVGGLVGYNYGSITNSYSTGNVSCDSEAGGFVGWNSGNITNSYSTGTVSGDSYVGGLVGYNYDYTGSITRCFWDKQTSGIDDGVGYGNSTGAEGKATAKMQKQSTFETAGWDFVGEDADWQMSPANSRFDGYPALIWQTIHAGDIAGDSSVNFVDFAVLAGSWNCHLGEDCYNPIVEFDNTGNSVGVIDLADLMTVVENWLLGTE